MWAQRFTLAERLEVSAAMSGCTFIVPTKVHTAELGLTSSGRQLKVTPLAVEQNKAIKHSLPNLKRMFAHGMPLVTGPVKARWPSPPSWAPSSLCTVSSPILIPRTPSNPLYASLSFFQYRQHCLFEERRWHTWLSHNGCFKVKVFYCEVITALWTFWIVELVF